MKTSEAAVYFKVKELMTPSSVHLGERKSTSRTEVETIRKGIW